MSAATHPSMLFVVDGDEIKVIRGDISPTVPSTPVGLVFELDQEGSSGPEHAPAPTSRPPTPPPKPQNMLAHALPQVPRAEPTAGPAPSGLSAPAPTRTPPPPPVPPPAPLRSMPKSPPQSLYLKRREVPRDSLFSNSSFDIEAMIERSTSPVGDPYDRAADEAFEHLHNEFMDLITISGAHARAQAQGESMGSDMHFGVQAEHGTTDECPTPMPPRPMPSIPESPLSALSALSTPDVTPPLNIRKHSPEERNKGYYDLLDEHVHDDNGNQYFSPAGSPPKTSSTRDGERNQSPSPPLLRTPETPPAPSLPDPPHRLFTKVPSASNIHERRRKNPHRKQKTSESAPKDSENAATRTRDWTSHQGQQAHGIQPQGPQGLSVFIAQGSPAPAIIVPPLNLPVPPIALGPLPPVPSPVPAFGRRSSPGTPSTGGTSVGINGPRSSRPPLTSSSTWSAGTTPSPSSAAANSAALAHLIFPSSASTSSGRHSTSSHMSRGSARRPASMQPSPSPREFSHSRHMILGTLTPGRPISAISYHFGGISISASSPVVQAFEDIGALPLTETNFNPAAPFTQPRPAPQPQASYRLGTPPDERGAAVDRAQDRPLSPVTPTPREHIPAKAAALLGIAGLSSGAPKKTSPFSKMTDLVRKRQAQSQTQGQSSQEHETGETGPRRGILGRHRASVVVDDKQQGLWRVQTADSSNVFWNDPESFAPLTGHAQRAADSTHSRSGTPTSKPLPLPHSQPQSHSISGPFAFALERRHAHKGSFSSTQSFPLSVGKESTYPSSVLSKKSSFEAPRHQTSPKVYANNTNLNSYVSSVDGGLSTSPLGHKAKSSLDGIPNLTPNSRVGLHSPPPSDHKIYKQQQGKSFHAPSLSPITYNPPSGGSSNHISAGPSSGHRSQSPPSPRSSPRVNNPVRGSPDMLIPGPPRTSSLAQTTPIAGGSPVRTPHSAPVRSAQPPRPVHGHSQSQGSVTHKVSTSMGSVGSMGSMGSMGSVGSGSGSERFDGLDRVERLERYERFPFPPTHIPVNLHLRPQPVPHPSHPRTRKGSTSGLAGISADESFFEPDTPSPRPAAFKGLRSAVKGHMWENRI